MATETVQNMFRRMISIKDLADYTGLTERTVYRLANDGKIPGCKLGGKWLFDKEIVTTWLTSQMINNCTSQYLFKNTINSSRPI